MQTGARQFVTVSEAAVSSTDDRSQLPQPDASSQPCAGAATFITSPGNYQPQTDSYVLQSHSDSVAAVTELTTAVPTVDLVGRLSKRVVLPLPTIQAIQLPLSQRLPLQVSRGLPLQVSQGTRVIQAGGGAVLPDCGSASAFLGRFLFTVNCCYNSTIFIPGSVSLPPPKKNCGFNLFKTRVVEALDFANC